MIPRRVRLLIMENRRLRETLRKLRARVRQMENTLADHGETIPRHSKRRKHAHS